MNSTKVDRRVVVNSSSSTVELALNVFALNTLNYFDPAEDLRYCDDEAAYENTADHKICV